MDYCPWSNVVPNYGHQSGRTSVRNSLEKATAMLANATEDPALSNPMAHIVFAL